MKKYAVAIDVSPSEQIGDDDDSIFCLGVLFCLKSPQSFNLVGDQFPDEKQRLRLRKYSGSSAKYKKDLVKHLEAIRHSGHVLSGVSVVNQRCIKRVGLSVWIKAHGGLPPPSSFNKKGKPRILLGEYDVEGKTRPAFEVLEDDLAIIGWLVLELGLLHKMLCEVNGAVAKLDIIIDRLPNENGAAGTNKAELLKFTLDKMSENTISVVGVPDIPDTHQRDLLADNIAGLGRDIFSNSDLTRNAKELKRIVNISRFNLPKRG
jgi:hypothetical protein